MTELRLINDDGETVITVFEIASSFADKFGTLVRSALGNRQTDYA